MQTFSSLRRDFLRIGGLGLAGMSLPSLAVAAPEAHGPMPHQPVFNVRSYGAVGDGKSVDTAAVNRAIEAAATASGGIVFFPAATYLCFSIHFRSYVHLYLEQGATILAADSPQPGQQTGYNGSTYDKAEPSTPWESYQDFGHNHWHNSLMWGEDIHDFSITGLGCIWGKGLSRGNSTSAVGPVFIAEQPGVDNKSIALKNCRNVLLRDFSVLEGGHGVKDLRIGWSRAAGDVTLASADDKMV